MSVEDSIANLLSTVRSISSTYKDEATTLIEDAPDALNFSYSSNNATGFSFDPIRKHAYYKRKGNQPELSEIPDFNLSETPQLNGLSGIDDQFSGTVPSLNFPDFSYSDFPTAPTFNVSTPKINSLKINPKIPLLTELTEPQLVQPNEINVDAISMRPDALPIPDFDKFEGSVTDAYDEGLSHLDSSMKGWSEYIKGLRTSYLPIETALQNKLESILKQSVNATGMTDVWEEQIFQQAKQEIFDRRYTAWVQLENNPSSITGLPTGMMENSRLQLELNTLQQTIKAASQTMNERQKQEVKHLQWALELSAKIINTSLNLQAQSVTLRAGGLTLALEGAKEALDLSVKVLEFKKKEIAAFLRYNEGQIRITEGKMNVEKTKLEKLKIEVTNNKLKSEYNNHQGQIYGLSSKFIEYKVSLYNAQIDYLVNVNSLNTLDLEIFSASVQAYQAELKSNIAEQSAIKARINGDLAKSEAELANVRLYSAQVKAKKADIEALQAKVKAIAEENKQKLTAYNTGVSAKIDYLKSVDELLKTEVTAFLNGFKADVAEQEYQIALQELSDREVINQEMIDLSTNRISLINSVARHRLDIEKKEAEGRIKLGGAQTLGNIAQAAYAGLNAVASQELLSEK